MKVDHPYKKYEGQQVWKVLSQGVEDLRTNGDLEEKTSRCYIIGYLSQLLAEAGLIGSPAPSKTPAGAAIPGGSPPIIEGDLRQKPVGKKKALRPKPSQP